MRESKGIRLVCEENPNLLFENSEKYDAMVNSLMIKMKDPTTEYGIALGVYTDTEDYRILWEECKKVGLIPVIINYRMDYTKKDIQSAEYFFLWMFNIGREDYTESFSTTYEESFVCKRCGKKLYEQKSDLVIDKTLFRKKDIGATTNNEIVVSERVKQIIEGAQLSGVEFAEVKHKNGRMRNDFPVYQLKAKNILTKMDDSTPVYYDDPGTRIGYCEVCKTHGVLLTSLPRYQNGVLDNAFDFNWTFERFGGGFDGNRHLIISKKAFDTFKLHKVKGFRFDIVLSLSSEGTHIFHTSKAQEI